MRLARVDLPLPERPTRRHHLPRLDGEIEIFQDGNIAARVGEAQVADFDAPAGTSRFVGAEVGFGSLVELFEDPLGPRRDPSESRY